MYRYDLAKAQSELSASPWPDGGFELDYVSVVGLDEEKKVGEIIGDQLAKLNIRVNRIPMSWDDAVSIFKNSRTAPDLFPLYENTAYSSPDNYLWSAFHSSQAGEWTNPGHYRNPVMDKILEQARSTTDEKLRRDLYDRAQRIVLDEAVNIFGVATKDFHIFSNTVKGICYCPVSGSEIDYCSLFLE